MTISCLKDQTALETLKQTICKGLSDEEFKIFAHACTRTALDPFMRQIYAVKRFDKNSGREVMTIQTGIDGYRLIAERTGKYSPGKEATYQYDKDGNLIAATAFIKKQTSDGTWHEISATAFWREFAQTTKEGKPTRFWSNMPHNQLAKCAEALALRKAFPAELSGVYTREEMDQAEKETAELESIPVFTEKQITEQKNLLLEHAGKDQKPFVKDYFDELSKVFERPVDELVMEFSDKEKFLRSFNDWKDMKKATSQLA